MQPGDQASLAFVIAVFLIFSAALAYATWLDSVGQKDVDSGKDKK